MNKILNSIIKIKRGLKANLANSGTNEGELKYATDTNELFIYSNGENKEIGNNGGDEGDWDFFYSFNGISYILNKKNRLLIQFGKNLNPAVSFGAITLPKYYKDKNYKILTTILIDSTYVKSNIEVVSQNEGIFNYRFTGEGANGGYFNFLTIGKAPDSYPE